MIFSSPPPNFHPKLNAVGCFLEHDGKFLILQRRLHKAEGGKWGMPAGKIDKGESLVVAMARELFEGRGFSISS